MDLHRSVHTLIAISVLALVLARQMAQIRVVTEEVYMAIKGGAYNEFAMVHFYAPIAATMHWYHDVGSSLEIMILDILYCKEAATMYLTDFVGYGYNDLQERTYRFADKDISIQARTQLAENLADIKRVLQSIYGKEVKVFLYNRGHFRATCQRHQQALRAQVAALEPRLPVPDLQRRLIQQLSPDWCRYARTFSRNRWRSYTDLHRHGGFAYMFSLFDRVTHDMDTFEKLKARYDECQCHGGYLTETRCFLMLEQANGNLTYL